MSKRRCPHESLTMTKYDKVTFEAQIIKMGKGTFKCTKCNGKFSRSFNAIRHFNRFHILIVEKRCCGKMFFTKGDYYKHHIQMHDDVKEHGKLWKMFQKFSKKHGTSVGPSIQWEKIFPQNENHANMSRDNRVFETQKSNITTERRRPRKNKYPKKLDICVTNHDQNRVPLQNIVNKSNSNFNINNNCCVNSTKNNASKTACVVKDYSMISSSVAQKENCPEVIPKLYVCNSPSRLFKTLQSINF